MVSNAVLCNYTWDIDMQVVKPVLSRHRLSKLLSSCESIDCTLVHLQLRVFQVEHCLEPDFATEIRGFLLLCEFLFAIDSSL